MAAGASARRQGVPLAPETDGQRSAECIAPAETVRTIQDPRAAEGICHARNVDLLITEVMFFGGIMLGLRAEPPRLFPRVCRRQQYP